MAVTYNPFISKYGFKSGDFEVNSLGNLTANDVVVNSIDAGSITINGTPIFANDDSTAAFQIDKDFIVSEGSTPYLSVINGQVTITNRSDSVGSINNVNIGTVTPGTGTFTNISTGPIGVPVIESNTNLILSANNAVVFKINGVNKGKIDNNGINVPIINSTINNTAIGNTTPSTGAFTSATVTNQPSLPASVTRKDYVDTKITAFSIAFGI